MSNTQHVKGASVLRHKEHNSGPLFTAGETPAKRRAKALLQALLRRAQSVGVFVETVDLTPELAELLLERNVSNRMPKEKVINDIALDIAEGRWDDLNGETLIVSLDGLLNDGQNRCFAVIKSGRPVQTLIAFGVPRESRRSVDSTQTTRTPGDFVTMEGIFQGNHVAAVAGYLFQVDRFGEIPFAPRAPDRRPTKQQLNVYVSRHVGEIQDALGMFPHKGATKIASVSLLAVASVIIGNASSDRDAIKEYLARIIDGGIADTKSGIHVARERLLEEKRKRTAWPHKVVEIILRGWNFYRQNQPTTKIQVMGAWPKIER